MVKRSFDSLIESDSYLATAVCAADDEMDDLHRRLFVILQERIKKAPERIEQYVHLLSVTRYLERIADQATNIAEDVIYNGGGCGRKTPREVSGLQTVHSGLSLQLSRTSTSALPFRDAQKLVSRAKNDYLQVKEIRVTRFLLFLLNTGCRRSEALGATWEDVDLERHQIVLRGQAGKMGKT